ncbi:MAG: mechanosensitive ion channel family protein [Acidobacteriota bacterium]
MFPPKWLTDEKQLWRVLEPLLTFLIALLATLVVRRLVLGWVRRRSRPGSFAAVFLDTVALPSILWCWAAAVAISLPFVELTAKQMRWASNAIVIFVIVSLTLVTASVAVRMIVAYGERQGMPFTVAGLSRTLMRALVLAIGLMILLAYLKIPITPLLTALGVGGIAVALALQDTLTNFFAGIHILVERPIFVGDFIRLETGQEGVVTDIGWRTTRIATLGGNVVVAPNTKITSGILVNYSLPDPGATIEVPVLVAHEADPDQVRAIALEEAVQAPGVAADTAPLVFCDPGVLPTHLQFKLLVRVANQTERGRIQSELRLRLLRRFRAAGVPLPNPALARYLSDADRG